MSEESLTPDDCRLHFWERAIEIIDAYCHCGLRKYEPIERVRAVLDVAGVNRAVLVQHLGEFDNSYLAAIAATAPERFASVCLVDHTASDAIATLEALAESKHFKGVRLTTEACEAAPGLLEAATDFDLIAVLYAPQGVAASIALLTAFLDKRPQARVVLTHFGTPDLGEAPAFPKHRAVFQLAQYPGVHLNISGMKMYCPFPHEPMYGLIEQAVESFGAQRMCWGSNFPVGGDARDYAQDLGLLLKGKLPVPQASIADIAGGNARRLWFE